MLEFCRVRDEEMGNEKRETRGGKWKTRDLR